YGTGETHSVREFCEKAFKTVGIKNWQKYVESDEEYFRPAEVDLLIADASKARKKLGWKPKTSFSELVRIMVEADLAREESQ
ncbi:unnamed protein product, partial [marine sediment metagenome]